MSRKTKIDKLLVCSSKCVCFFAMQISLHALSSHREGFRAVHRIILICSRFHSTSPLYRLSVQFSIENIHISNP